MLKQTRKLLFTGVLLAFANHGLFNTAAHASFYSDIVSLPSGNDKLAAEAVAGPTVGGPPPINIPAETWIAKFRYGPDANKMDLGSDDVFDGTGPTGVMIAGSAQVKTINTKSIMTGYAHGKEVFCQYTYDFVLHDMQTGTAQPIDDPLPVHSYISL